MNKKVNMSDISNKIQFIYKDECEKNIAGIIIYDKDGKFFFDAEFKNEMSNEEVEALLIRNAVINRGGKYYKPSSFNNEYVSFSDGVINPDDIVMNKEEPEMLDIPKVFFYGYKPTTKDEGDEGVATIEYISKSERFKGYVSIKCQGTSSMNYSKKNYTIKMYTDETLETKLKKDFKSWGEQTKFCLKANFIDHSHARNICGARLWNQVVSSRNNYSELPELLRTSPRNGAIDGFPIKLYYNNSYEGIYTWNIPKDAWMFNMDDSLDEHCVLCGEEFVSGHFELADATLWSDEIHDEMPVAIENSFNNFINFVMNSSDEEFKSNLENYVYVDSVIDYFIFQNVIAGMDSMGKNQIFATYDGVKWIASSYDMDSTFGLFWDGTKYIETNYNMSQAGGGNKLYARLENLFLEEIRERYSELRETVLSYANVVNTFERFIDVIGENLYDEDNTIYTEIPNCDTNNIKQIRDYYRDRLIYVDAMMSEGNANTETNLLVDPNINITTSDTRIDTIALGQEKPIKGESYTLTIKGTLGDDRTHLVIFDNTGDLYITEIWKNEDRELTGIYQDTFVWPIDDAVDGIAIYQRPQEGTSISTIEWVKLEKGDR